MKLSVVSTLYSSAPFLEEFLQRISSVCRKLTEDYEIVLVNDGSPDNSLELAVALQTRHPQITVLDLSRNFGHHPAIMAGVDYAMGDLIFLIDSDLEDAPELLISFHEHMQATQCDVVFGKTAQRNGGWLSRHAGLGFYKVFNALSGTPIPENPCTVRLMRRNYVNAVKQVRDKNLFLAGTFTWAGFRQEAFTIKKHVRNEKSSYSLRRMVALSINAVTSFSARPLHFAFYTGALFAALSMLAALYLIAHKILNPTAIQMGYTSIILSIFFVGGLIIFFLGVIGIYISRIFNETKDRPLYLVKNVIVPNRERHD